MLYEKIKNDYQNARKLVPVDPVSRDLLMSIVSELDSVFKQNGVVSYMPAQLDSPTMATIVGSLILNNTNTMQLIMKFFKENYNGMYDAKSLSSIVKAALSKP